MSDWDEERRVRFLNTAYDKLNTRYSEKIQKRQRFESMLLTIVEVLSIGALVAMSIAHWLYSIPERHDAPQIPKVASKTIDSR